MLTVRLVWPTSRFNPTLPRCTESEALLPLPHESHLSLMLDVLVSDTRSGSHRSDQSVPQCPQSKQLVWAAMRGRCRPGTRTEPTYTLTVFMMVYKSYIDPGHGLVWFWSFIQYGRLCFYLFNTKHSFFILITLFPEEGGCGRTRGQTSKSKTQNKTRKNLLWVSAAGGTLSSSLHFKLKRFYVSVFTRVKVLCMFSDVFLLSFYIKTSTAHEAVSFRFTPTLPSLMSSGRFIAAWPAELEPQREWSSMETGYKKKPKFLEQQRSSRRSVWMRDVCPPPLW